MTAAPTLTIVIVSYNARSDLERCLRGLTEHAAHTPHQIVVVDNASSDGTPTMVRSLFPGVAVIEHTENLGFAVATNHGIRSTSSDLVLLLNGDTVVPAGAIDHLVNVLRANPGVTIVGPRLVDQEGVAELSTGAMIGPLTELGQKIVGVLHRRGFPPVRRYVERLSRLERRPDWVSGACLMMRRAEAERAGLLDERYFLYNEDVDLCAAVRRAGGGVVFTPQVTVVHRRGRSAATAPSASAAAYRRSQIAFYRKHHPRWVPVLEAFLRLTGRHPS